MPRIEQTDWRNFCKRPDEPSFAPIFEASKGAVYTICRRILGDEEDALDAYQSAYCRLIAEAHESGASMAEEDGDRWVLRLSVREAQNLRQRRRRRLRRETRSDFVMLHPDPSPSPSVSAASAELRHRVEGIVATLPDRFRTPLILHFDRGLSQAEIADLMGVPARTISSRIAAGLRKLRPLMRRAGLGDPAKVLGAAWAARELLAPPASVGAAAIYAMARAMLTAGAAAGGIGASTLLGVEVMKSKTAAIVALVAIALGGIGVALWSGSSPSDRNPDRLAAGGATSDAELSRMQPTDANAPFGAASENPGATERTESGAAPPGGVSAGAESPTGAGELGAAARTADAGAVGAADPRRPGATDPTAEEEAQADEEDAEAARAPARIFGSVLLAQGGAPVAEARVLLLRGQSSVLETRTDDTGAFAFEQVEPESVYRLHATHDARNLTSALVLDELPPVHVGDGENSGPHELRALTGGRVTIRVVAESTGAPIEGALAGWAQPMSGEHYRNETRTDGEGKAVFGGFGVDLNYIYARADGFALTPKRVRAIPGEDNEFEIALPRAGSVFGRVLDQDGAPLADAAIAYMYPGYNRELIRLDVVSGADGSYRVDHLPLGSEIALRGAKIGFQSERWGVPAISREDRERQADLRMRSLESLGESFEPGVIIGVVADAAGAPIGAAETMFVSSETLESRKAGAGPEGRFTLTDLQYARVEGTLTVRADGFVPFERRVTPGTATAPLVLPVRLDRGRSIQGVVVDESGRPVSAVSIAAHRSLQTLGAAITGADGRFRFDNLPPGSTFRFEPPTQALEPRVNISLPLDRDDARVVLVEAGMLYGAVVDADTGEPIPRFEIDSTGDEFAFVAFSSPKGEFRLYRIARRSAQTVTVKAEGYPLHVFNGARIRTESQNDPATFELRRDSKRLIGRIVDSTGRGRGDVEARLYEMRTRGGDYRGYNADGRFLGPPLRLGPDGAFSTEIPPDPSILVDMIVTGPGLADRRVSGLESLSETERQNFIVMVPRGARVFGRVNRVAHPTASSVVLQPLGEGAPIEPGSLTATTTFNLGYGVEEYAFEGVLPGSYSVRLLDSSAELPRLPDSPGSMVSSARAEIAVQEGRDERVDLGFGPTSRLSGRALIGDAPLALRPLALTLGGGVAVRAVLTDAEGRFAMNDIPDDYYTLVAIVEDRPGAEAVGNSIFRHPVQVEGGEVSGDFVFTAGPTVTVIGRVVGSAASAAPILSLTGLASTIPPGSSRAGQFTREIAPDFSGLFQVPLVPAGTYQLALVAGAMRRPILTNIRVTGEAPLVDLGDVEIQAGGSLRIVLDGDGINRTTPIEVAVDQDLTALEPGVTPFGWISVRFPPGKSEHVIADIAPTRLVLQTTIGRGGSAYGSIDEVTREFGYETPDSQVRAEIVGGVEAEAVIRLRAYTFLRMQPSSPSRPVSRFVMTRVETGQVMDLPILPSPATEEYLKSEPNYAFISAGHPFVKGIEPGRWQVDYTTPGGTFRLLFDLQPGDPILTIQRSLVPQERIGPPPGEARFN